MQKYFLHINEPCSEDWDCITPNEKGRFCNNCNKTVFDFTTATDNDIIKNIEKMKGNMFCGQFEEGQLNRWIHTSSLKTSNKKLYELLLSFLLLSGTQNLYAQEVYTKEKIELQKKADSLLSVTALKAEMPDVICDKKMAFPGTRVNLQGNGNPSKMRIGGVRTITDCSKRALLVLNGVPSKLSKIREISPSDIESINVLKPKEAMAVYGSAGVNGAILVVTKDKTRQKLILKKNSNK